MKRVFFGLSVLLFSTSLSAETLEEAFLASYQNNPTLKAERAKLRATDETYSQASSGWRPNLKVVGDVSYVDSSLKLKDGVRNDSDRVPYGGKVVLTQPIFSGYETVASQKSAENSIKAGRYSLKKVEQDLLTSTAKAYTGVVCAEAALRLNQNKEQVYHKHVEESKQKYEVGEITVTDYAQSEARYEGAKADRIASEGDLKNAKTYYETVTGVAPVKIDEFPPIPLALMNDNLDDTLNKALTDNPEIMSAVYMEKSARNDVTKAGSALLPSLDASASGSLGRNQQYDDDKYREFKAVATLTIPLYEAGFSYSKVRQAKQIANQKRLDIDTVRLKVKNNVFESWENLVATKAKLNAYKSQIKAYEIAVESTRREWEVGTKTMVDVMDAEQDLLDAKLNEIKAKGDEVVESFNLIALCGNLTMDNLNIGAEIYDPVANYEKVKGKWFGTGIKEEKTSKSK